MRRLNPDQLRTFREVIARGSFSAAADRLGLTQPAVSIQIRNLETRVGVRLIERAGKHIHPTRAGRDLLSFARRSEESERAILTRMRGYEDGRYGSIRLGTGATACIYRLPAILADLRAAHPGFEIIVVTGNAPEMLDAVESNALDMAIVTQLDSRSGLSIAPICRDSLMAILPAASTRKPASLSPRSRPHLPLILYEKGDPIRDYIDAWFLAGGIRPRPAMELGSIEAIKNLVGAGLGYSIVPAVSVSQAQHRESLRIIPLTPRLQRPLGLATRRDKELDFAMQEMVTALQRLQDI